MSSRASEVIGNLLQQIFEPRENISPADWVEREIRLDAKTSNKAGRYSLRHTPYLKKIYEDIGNPRIRKVILKKAAQVGATQFANNILLYYVCNHTFPILMIMPSRESAMQFCERSLTPSIFNCQAVQEYLTGKDDDLKKTEFLFTSCIARVIGAGSPSKLASNPACLCIIDEADKMETFESIGEAPALELAEARTISFPNDKKIVILSTPTSENTSVIHSQYLLGSQSKFFCTCPRCGSEQTLAFENIKWPEACKTEQGSWDLDSVERLAYYECIGCKSHLSEQDKIGMVRGGTWKDTNPNPFASDVRSYHISALYSFNVSWGSLAKQFLQAKDDPGKLRNFYNSFLGECFEQRAATIKSDDIAELIRRSPVYIKGELLAEPEVVLMAADTQGDCFWFTVTAYYPDGSCSLVDFGQAATFEDLAMIQRRQYRIRGTESFQGIWKSLIDFGGNRTTQVYDFCIKSGFAFHPVAGRQENNGLLAPVRETFITYQGKQLPALFVNDKAFKDRLYLQIIKERNVPLYLPQDADEELKIQLTSEKLVEKTVGGRVELNWICTNRKNHLGDCLKYTEGFRYWIEPTLHVIRERKKLADAKQQPQPEERVKREYVLHGYENPWN